MNNKAPQVSIIVLNWNGWEDTLECLESIYHIEYSNYDVLVVDNDSQDDSINKIKQYAKGLVTVESVFFEYNSLNKPLEVFEFSEKEYLNPKTDLKLFPSDKKLILLKNQENYGYAKGNNLAIDFALKKLNSDYILILNNDTVVDVYFLDDLVKTIEENSQNGIVGPAVYYYHQKDKISIFGGNINKYTGRTNYPRLDTNYPGIRSKIDFISGCCLLIKKEVIQEIGLLNSEYFLYYEDVEWCYRARKYGYDIIYEPEAKIWHKESFTAKNPTGVYFLSRNRIWFMKEYATSLQYFVFFFFSLTYFIYHLLRFAKNKKLIMALYRGMRDGYQSF